MNHDIKHYDLGASVAVFGSARVKEDHPHYKAAVDLGYLLGDAGINVLTGGGPGIMEAALRGCHSAGKGQAIGIRIHIPAESTDDPTQWHHVTEDFSNFSARQCTLIQNADVHCAFIGGVGTLFEIAEVMTLMQTGFLARRPIVLYDTGYWLPLLDFVEFMEAHGTVGEGDSDLLYITNSVYEMFDKIIEVL